ncbi:hypothetical protein MKX03_021454 [Papaver bracteatum]|nr:hypothetical protein MKX03_021454 [Papaver bracteatum]
MSRVYKTVAYGLRYLTINQRLKKSAQEFDAHYDELSKATADLHKWSCPKKIEEAIEVFKAGNECKASVKKVLHDCEHFKLHEEPKRRSRDMFRDHLFPSAAAAMIAVLLAEFRYRKQLKDKYQALVKEPAAVS